MAAIQIFRPYTFIIRAIMASMLVGCALYLGCADRAYDSDRSEENVKPWGGESRQYSPPYPVPKGHDGKKQGPYAP